MLMYANGEIFGNSAFECSSQWASIIIHMLNGAFHLNFYQKSIKFNLLKMHLLEKRERERNTDGKAQIKANYVENAKRYQMQLAEEIFQNYIHFYMVHWSMDV